MNRVEPQRRRRILIVEDEAIDSTLAEAVFDHGGFLTRCVSNAADARECLRRFKPDAMLLDMRLPKEDGLWLARQVTSTADSADIVIIAVTAHPERYSRGAAFAAGCHAYIVKPFNTRLITGQVIALIEAMKGKKE